MTDSIMDKQSRVEAMIYDFLDKFSTDANRAAMDNYLAEIITLHSSNVIETITSGITNVECDQTIQ